MSYWQTGTATDYHDMLDQMIEMATSDHVATAAVGASGGSAYVVGEKLTLTDGTKTHSAVLEVTSVSSGAITGLRVDEGGAYTVDPDLTDTTSFTTDGSGTGAQLDLTMHDRSVQTVTINNDGSSYAVNDVLTVAGGTGTSATLLVTAVDGSGNITAIRVQNGGLYSANPTLTANAVTGGSGSGATMDLAMGGQWRVERRSQEAVSATIASGGTGYSVNDKLTLVDDSGTVRGDVSDTTGVAAVFNVDTVSSGVVTAVSLDTAGNYEEIPGDPVATTVAPSGGSGCTLNVMWQDATTQDQVLIMKSVGDSGTDEIFVGVKTFNRDDVTSFETVYNWAIFGMTAYNSGLPFHQQPGISPGVDTSGSVNNDTDGGAIVPLKDSDAFNMSFWFSTRPNRIMGVCKVENVSVDHYPSFYMGFHDPFGTDAEVPYPIYIAGSTSRDNSLYTDTIMGRITGLTECVTVSSREGPAFARVNGNWTAFQNGNVVDTGSPTRTALRDFTVWPMGEPTLGQDSDDIITIDNSDCFQWSDAIPTTNVPGSADVQLWPTDNTGDDVRLLVPATLLATDNPGGPIVYDPIGQINNVFWVSAAGSTVLTSEDTFDIGDDRYVIFENGNQTEVWSYMAIKAD